MQANQKHEHRRAVRYLPRTLIEYWACHPGKPPIWGEWLEGSLMHCDVTGFTAMSESLAKSGKEGAEIMAGILNQFFERMLGIANEWNGIQMKFGGDAMLLYFTGNDHAECAAACGLQMQSAMEEFSQVNINDDICKLRMRIGIHSGKFYTISAGQEEGLLHYLLIGNEVNKAADVEPMAEPDQVVVSDETKALLSNKCSFVKTQHSGIWWIKKSGKPTVENTDLDLSNIPRKFLRRYLMPPIAEGMTTGLLGEHRRVTVVFINLFGLSEILQNEGDQNALSQANEYLNFLFDTLIKYGGHLITSDVCEHGDKLLLAFGAPISLDSQEENAMRFAIELQEQLGKSSLKLEQSIGINSGFVFTGEIGSSKRREYTTIGDTTNLAARLMSAANKGSIIVSATTAERTGNIFELKQLDSIRVKGKSQLIDIYKLLDIKYEDISVGENEEAQLLIGRDQELNQLKTLVDPVINGNCKLAYVFGDPGIGKSHLCSVLLSDLKRQNWLTMLGICQSYNLHNAFSVWVFHLRKIFGIKPTDSPEKAWKKIKNNFKKKLTDQSDFAPLMAEILSVPCESNAVVNSLDPKSKRERRIEVITQLLHEISKDQPLILLFDNAQWLDTSSAEVIQNILSFAKNSPIYICLISRSDSLSENLKTFEPDLLLNVKELSNRSSKELISLNQTLSNDAINSIIARAKGNPLFLIDLAQSYTLNQGALPESIVDVIMVKLDQMSDQDKMLLRSAAVIGQVFDLQTLDTIVFDKEGSVDEKD